MVAEKLGFFAVGQFVLRSRKRTGGAKHGGKRRLEVVRYRGQERGAQALGLGGALNALHILDQLHAFDGERPLIC